MERLENAEAGDAAATSSKAALYKTIGIIITPFRWGDGSKGVPKRSVGLMKDMASSIFKIVALV
jgi:hypothetical protein